MDAAVLKKKQSLLHAAQPICRIAGTVFIGLRLRMGPSMKELPEKENEQRCRHYIFEHKPAVEKVQAGLRLYIYNFSLLRPLSSGRGGR